MVNFSKVTRGIANYIDREIMPSIPSGTFKKVAIGAYISLVMRNAENSILPLLSSAAASMTGVIEKNGDIDIDTLAEAIKQSMPTDGFPLDVNVLGLQLGKITFSRSDIDTIANYIKSA